MNKIYNLIWNEAKNTWIAVAENTKTRGKRASGVLSKSVATSLLILSSTAWAAPPVTELPTGGNVVAGQASINQSGSVMNINQTTNKSAVNWNTFSVGANATVNFKQPSANSVTLNRVQSGNASQIFGKINANGQVFLTNPSGAYFAPGASVNVGGLVATTHNISNDDFMAGNYTFNRNGAEGSIINEGDLNADLEGYIALLAPEVRNQGVIIADLGTVALAAGESYQLQIDSNGSLTNLQVEPATIDTLVENGNAVRAQGGLIILSAQSINTLQGGVINSTGNIEATGIVSRNGKIILDSGENGTSTVSGVIDVSNQNGAGGDITITAKDILVKGTTQLLARGSTGGGKIEVGGSWQNSDLSVKQAITTSIESGALLDASATENGDGGTVVAWSDITNPDSVTTVDGTILAKAGLQSGDGGNIETSGYKINYANATINASSVNGNGGLWLIDPNTAYNVIDQTNANIIASSLNNGTSVTNLVTAGDIAFNDNVSISKTSGGNATLTLKTPNSIFMGTGSSIKSTSGELNIVLWSNSSNLGGRIELGDSVNLLSNGGDITLGGGSNLSTGYADGLSVAHGIYTGQSSNIVANGGNIIMRGTTSWGAAPQAMAISSTISTSGSGSITLNGSAGSGGADWTYGILLRNSAVVQAENGTINITGTGLGNTSNDRGVSLENNARISSTSGAINITGYASSAVGLSMVDTSSIYNASGHTTINSDRIVLDGTLTNNGLSQAELTIKPTTSGRGIGIGYDWDLYIPTNYLSSKFSGFQKITIGSTSSGTLIIGDDFSFNDPLSLIAGGNFEISSGGSYSTLTGNNNNLTVSSPTNIYFDHTVNLGSGSLIKEGSGLLRNNSASHTYNNLLINNGSVQMQASNFASSPDVYVASGAEWNSVYSGTIGTISGGGDILTISNLTLASPNGETFSGTLSSFSSSSNIIKNGTGSLTLSGNSPSFLGTITVNAGTLIVSNTQALGTSAKGTIVASGATLDVRANVGSEPVTLNGGTLSVPSGSVSMSGALTLGANSTISVGGTQLALSGVIDDGAGTYGFTKTGSGSLLLSGANTYGGATTISAGPLNLGASNVIPDASAVSLALGTTFNLNNYSDTIGSLTGAGNVSLGSAALTTGGNNTSTTYSGVISGTGSLVKNGSGTFILSGNNTYSGTTTINGGSLQLGSGGTSGIFGTGNVSINNSSFLNFNRSGSLSVINNISGVGYVIKKGSSSLTLSGNNSFTKTTFVQAGQLIVTSDTGLGSTAGSTSISSGASLDLKNVTIGNEYISIASGATLKTSSGISSVTGAVSPGIIDISTGAQLTLSGMFDDDNTNTSLVKNGAGTLIITNNTNNYGATLINAGTLQVGNGGNTGKLGRLGVTNNAALYINRSDSPSLSSIVSSTSGITGTGSVTAHIGGSLNVDRTINLSGASSKIILAAGYNTAAGTESGGDVTLTNTITTSNTGTVTIFSGNTNTSTLNSKIAGATGATKYKTYNVNNTAIAGAVSGTRNYYYRRDPKLTISGLTASKTYDGNTNAATSLSGGTVLGNIDGDTYSLANLTRLSATYNTKDVGSRTLSASYTAPTRTASGYTVSGYDVNAYSQAGAGTISKKTVSLSGAKTYDGNTALTIGEVTIATGVGTETLTFSGATANDSHVSTTGKYIDAITLGNGSNGGLASNYALPTLNTANAAVTISAKTLTPTLSNTGVTKVYDGITSSPTGFTPTYTYSGFVAGDTDAALSNTAMVYNSSHVASANKITVSGLSINSITGSNSSLGSDYVLNDTSKDVTATITPATLTTSLTNTGVTKVYDGTANAPAGFTPTYNITGFVSGDTAGTITNTGSVYDDAHVVNASKITVSGLAVGSITGNKGSQASDYALDASSKEVTAAITPKDLTPVIGALNVSKTYDGSVDGTSALNYSYGGISYNGQTGSGLIDGDTDAGLTHTSYIYDSKDVGVASKVTVSGLQVDAITGTNSSLASDYALTTSTLEQVGSIGQKEVTLAASKVYDSTTNLTNAVIINTNIAGEELTYSNAAAGSAHVSHNAFNQILSITLENNGAVLASNYILPTLNFSNAPVEITPASLTATLNNTGVTKVYDGTTDTPAGFTPTYTVTGFVSGDTATTISNTAQYYDDAHVLTATKVGVSGMAITGITGSNSSQITDYVLTANSSETAATITQATLTPTITNTSVTKVYDGTTDAPAGFAPTYSYAGLVTGDTDATLSHSTAFYDDKNVLDASQITVGGLSIGGITGSRNSVASDYILDATSKTKVATITERIVGLEASKIYDGTTVLNSSAVTVLTNIGGETLTYSGATANDSHVATANKFINNITLLDGGNGGVASNYILPTLNHANAPVTITPASLTATLNNTGVTKVYDGTTDTPAGFTPTYTVTGFVSGDTASAISNTTQSYDDAHVLTATKVGVSGMAITGITGSNSSEITDYVLTENSSETAATITPATLTPTITNTSVTKIYDGTTDAPAGFAPTYSYAGLVTGDTDATLSHSTAFYDDKNVLDASQITVGGLSIGGITGSLSSVASDYVLDATSKTKVATITERTVGLEASKIYDGTIVLNSSAVTVLTGVGNETLTYSGATANNAYVATAGKYIDNITLVDGSGLASNYQLPTLDVTNAPVSITPATLIITANDDSKVYDGSPYSGGNGVVYAGFVEGETPDVLSGTLTYSGSSQGATNAGNYVLTPQGLSSDNYAISYTNNQLDISLATLNIAANADSKVYDGLAYRGGNGVVYTGFVNGEISAVLAGTLDYVGSSQGATNAGNYVLAAQGLSSDNYVLSYIDSQLIIDPLPEPPPSYIAVSGGVEGASAPSPMLDFSGVSVNLQSMPKLGNNGIIIVTLPEGSSTSGTGFSFPLPGGVTSLVKKNNGHVQVSLPNGESLPGWLMFNPKTLRFTSGAVPDQGLPVEVIIDTGSSQFTLVISERVEA